MDTVLTTDGVKLFYKDWGKVHCGALRQSRSAPLRCTAYSLRHTYICLRLMEGADICQIAKNCGTSVGVIEKYYASHIKTSPDASTINVRKSKMAPILKDREKTKETSKKRGRRPEADPR